jgi:putative mRNA 3-end processing factor
VLSDHADWTGLLRTVRETGARRVLVTHGYSETLAHYLRDQGVEAATLATPYVGEAED